MLITSFVAALFAVTDSTPGEIYHGRSRQTVVKPPRVDTAVVIDGALTERVWQSAAVLTGFSQYQPADQRASTDSTEVLVWYSPTAIHFGIRAFSPPGSVNARLSDRDKIDSDDHVQIILSTFNDGRQAFVFGVNPLGVQADGTINEGTRHPSRGGMMGETGGLPIDLSANFVFESKGRVTEYGYEVEVQLPFKSIRYQSGETQDWGLQLIRQVQHLGHLDTWTPAQRGAASFLAQSGQLKGLTGLSRGLVVDLNPSVVARQLGREKTDGSWGYDPDGPEYGATVKWGITNNLTLNGTLNPDFSQIEADVVAFQYDPRQALFYPERRPFFLEGIENFSAPNGLVYTRTIVQPDLAVKLTGKALGTNLAILQALDDRTNSTTRDARPFFNVIRATRDVGGQSRLGFTATDRQDGNDYNRVLGADARLVAFRTWSLNLSGAGSWTRRDGTSHSAPIWNASLARNGRFWDLNASVNGIDPEFEAQAGFVGRRGIVDVNASSSWTWYGAPGSRVETRGFTVRTLNTYVYDAFLDGKASQDRKLHLMGNTALRGGWRINGGVFLESFGFDPELYVNYYLERTLPGGAKDTVKFTGEPRLYNFDVTFRVATPEWSKFSGDFFYVGGTDENFDEWSSGLVHFITLNARYRPTDQLRVEAQYQHQEFNRISNKTTVKIRKVPRLKVEYQMTRSIFLRLVGQYDAFQRDSLYDDSRTYAPILFRQPDGSFVAAGPTKRNTVRADWLFSYQPTPGTVFFFGYGSTMREDDQFRFRNLSRSTDGFFLKWSYLYRL